MATFEWARTASQLDALDKPAELTLGEEVATELDRAAWTRPGDTISSADYRFPISQHIMYGEDWEFEEQLGMAAKVAEAESLDAISGLRNVPPVLGPAVMALISQR